MHNDNNTRNGSSCWCNTQILLASGQEDPLQQGDESAVVVCLELDKEGTSSPRSDENKILDTSSI